MEAFRKTGILAFSLLTKTIISLIIIKIGAIYLGVDQFGLTGQIANILNIIVLVSGCGVYIGVSKYYSNDERLLNKEKKWLGNALFLVSASCFLLIYLLLYFEFYITSEILNNNSNSKYIIYSLALSVPIIGISSISIGIMNGNQRDNLYYFGIFIGAILGLLGSILLIILFEGEGVLISIIWMTFSQSLVQILLSRKIIKFSDLKINFNVEIVKKLLSYGSLAVIAGATIPVTTLFIRTHLQVASGDYAMGIYQALSRLSESYNQLPIILLTSYYFPKFSKGANDLMNIDEIIKSFLHIGAYMILTGLIIYSLRNLIIEYIFTEEFWEISDYLIIQIYGDTMKVLSFLGATILMGRGFIKMCNFGTLLHVLMLAVFSYYMINSYGLTGAIVANAITYTIYFILIIFVIKNIEKKSYN